MQIYVKLAKGFYETNIKKRNIYLWTENDIIIEHPIVLLYQNIFINSNIVLLSKF